MKISPLSEKTVKKSREEDADASSSISHLPDEIILQILKKIIDLKTLCCCYLVSKRFSSIVVQVEAISFTTPLLNPNAVGDVVPSTLIRHKLCTFYGKLFVSATNFLSKFREVKCLSIQLPSSGHKRAIDNGCLFKWKVNFGSRVDSFIFLSPNSICDKDGFRLSGNGDDDEEEEDDMGLNHDFLKLKFDIFIEYLNDVVTWHIMLMYIVKDLPKLEKVSVTDSGRSGSLSLSGGKLGEVKEWVHSASETEFDRVVGPTIMSRCYIPVLELPVSGYVMKGVYCVLMEMKDLQDGNDGLINSEYGVEDKEEAAYTESVKEILEKHKAMMHVSEVLFL